MNTLVRIAMLRESFWEEYKVLSGRYNIEKHCVTVTDNKCFEQVKTDLQNLFTLFNEVGCEANYYTNENGYIAMIQLYIENDGEVWEYEIV